MPTAERLMTGVVVASVRKGFLRLSDLAELWAAVPPHNQRALVKAAEVLDGAQRGGQLEWLANLPGTSALAKHRAQLLISAT